VTPQSGVTRPKRLLDRFGTIAAVITAPAEDLAAVPGIGKGAAERIR